MFNCAYRQGDRETYTLRLTKAHRDTTRHQSANTSLSPFSHSPVRVPLHPTCSIVLPHMQSLRDHTHHHTRYHTLHHPPLTVPPYHACVHYTFHQPLFRPMSCTITHPLPHTLSHTLRFPRAHTKSHFTASHRLLYALPRLSLPECTCKLSLTHRNTQTALLTLIPYAHTPQHTLS